MHITEWNVSEVLRSELKDHYKTAFSLSLKNEEPLEIARALTFDGLPSRITKNDLTEFLTLLNEKFLGGKIQGVGVEVGSGPGTFVAALATMPLVTKVYGVEACEAIVHELMPRVTAEIAGEDEGKVVGAVADFDHLNLPDESVDFIFDFFSLHHSPDPLITIKELSRVLRKGGVVICVDKARADSLSKEELDALLDIEYPQETKVAMGLPGTVRHTRRMNGEHEYRLKDWNEYFVRAGFLLVTHFNVTKIGGNGISRFVKKIFSFLPIPVQRQLSSSFSRVVVNHLEPSNRIFTNIFPAYPRDFSLMIAQK